MRLGSFCECCAGRRRECCTVEILEVEKSGSALTLAGLPSPWLDDKGDDTCSMTRVRTQNGVVG